MLGLSPADPGGVVVTLNLRDRNWPDVYRIDIASGVRTLLQRNAGPRGFSRFVVDRDNRVRLGVRPLQDGGAEVASLDADGNWTTLFEIPFVDAMSSRPLVFEADGPADLVRQHLSCAPVPPSRRGVPGIPPALDELIMQCLAKEPSARPASARAIDERLGGLDSEWTVARARDWWERHAAGGKTERSDAWEPARISH